MSARGGETLVAFSKVSRGTTGVVVCLDEAASGFDVGIRWELPERRTKLLADEGRRRAWRA
jgi:hypothetical protein